MKDGIVAITQAMINLKAAGFKPKRDIVVLFTGDEETNGLGAKHEQEFWQADERGWAEPPVGGRSSRRSTGARRCRSGG